MKKYLSKMKQFLNRKNRIIIALVFIVFLILFAPIQNIEVGYEGILYNSLSGKVSTTLAPGWHVVIPFMQRLTVYPVNDRTYKIYRDYKNWNNGIDASIVTPASDYQEVSIDATFRYDLDNEKLDYIFESFDGKDIDIIERDYLHDAFRSSVINSISQYTAYEVYSSKREEVQNIILNDLIKKLTNTGIHLKYVYFDTVRLSTATEAIIRAQTLAEAARIEAQGESDANKLISESLTDKIVMYETLNKLSEKLRLIILPSGTDGQLDFSNILEKMLSEAENYEE